MTYSWFALAAFAAAATAFWAASDNVSAVSMAAPA